MENLRADTALKREQARWEPWKVMTAAVTATAALFGAVFGVLGYILGQMHH